MRGLADLKNLVSVDIEGTVDYRFEADPWDFHLIKQIQEIIPTLRRVFLSIYEQRRVLVLEASSWQQEMRWSDYELSNFTRWQMVTDWYADVHRWVCLV